MHNERIENKRYEKNIKVFKWSAILSIIIVVIRLLLEPSLLSGIGSTLDLVFYLYPIPVLILYYRTAKKWGGQFIEWTENEISFKSRKYEHTTIQLSDINSINIRLHFIEIDTAEKKYKINIEDYSNYEDRIRLKNNFEKVKKKLNQSTTSHSS